MGLLELAHPKVEAPPILPGRNFIVLLETSSISYSGGAKVTALPKFNM